MPVYSNSLCLHDCLSGLSCRLATFILQQCLQKVACKFYIATMLLKWLALFCYDACNVACNFQLQCLQSGLQLLYCYDAYKVSCFVLLRCLHSDLQLSYCYDACKLACNFYIATVLAQWLATSVLLPCLQSGLQLCIVTMPAKWLATFYCSTCRVACNAVNRLSTVVELLFPF
jgi:hypothetical protein